jgi:PIN domain nuclease of toxin-antitoxin system
MTKAPLLDTHVWVWWMLGDSALKPAERSFLDGLPGENRPFLCDISLWEIALLVECGRLRLETSLENFLEVAASSATVRLLPISTRVVVEMNNLPASFHRDPADRLIVASARSHGLQIATRDDRIRKSRLVKLWKI